MTFRHKTILQKIVGGRFWAESGKLFSWHSYDADLLFPKNISLFSCDPETGTMEIVGGLLGVG
jgi:hypothetical protein